MKKTSFILTAILFAVQFVFAQQAYDFSPEAVKDRLRQDIEVLASEKFEGRESGTEGERLAAEYLRMHMEEIGLKPVFGDSYFQYFNFSGGWIWGDENALVVDGHSYEHGEHFYTLPGTANATVTAAVFDAGLGLSALNIAEGSNDNTDATGKIMLVEYFIPRHMDLTVDLSIREVIERKLAYANKAGAAAVLFKNTLGERQDPRMDLRISAEQQQIPIMFVSEDVVSHILNHPTEEITLTTALDRPEVPSMNVAGYIDNNAPTTVVFGGHFDHLGYGGRGSRSPGERVIHYGADDNASGTAGVLEAARYLTNSTLTNNNYLFIAFGAEEKGLVGSRHFTTSGDYPMERINYMFNLDMIGRVTDSKVTLIGTGSSPVWDDMIDRHTPESLVVSKSPGGLGGSDHAPFYMQNIPVIFFFSGIHSDYHMPSDTPDKINYEGAYDVISMMYGMVAELDGIDRLAFTRAPETSNRRQRAEGPAFGLMPDHTFEGEGLKIQAVIDNRPAQQAGMKDGDVIVRINNMEIREIQTYMEALGKLERGQSASVVVKRGGEEVTIQVQL